MGLLDLLLIYTILTWLQYTQCFDDYPAEFTSPTVPIPKRLHLDGSIGNVIYRNLTTGCMCRENPDFYSVCFGRNTCTAVPRNVHVSSISFKITNTQIKVLRTGDFERLEHLVELQIEGNYELERISNKTFRNLANLVNLSIVFNSNLRTLEKETFSGLSKLKLLFLNNNGLENLHDVTSSLSSANVPNLLTLILDGNKFKHIQEQDFEGMINSTLEQLSLVFCFIEDIHPQAMLGLKHLQILHLGQNDVDSDNLAVMLSNMLDVRINLKALNLFDMGFRRTVPKSLMEIIAKTNISSLNLSRNQFEIISSDSFPLMPNVNILDLREVLALEVSDDAFLRLPNLKVLFLSGNKFTQVPNGVLRLSNLTFLDMQNNSPVGDSHHIYFSLKEFEFSDMNSLIQLKLSFNGIAHLYDNSLKGLNNLQVLELKNSSIFHMTQDTFAPLAKLRFLDLSNNFPSHGEGVPDVFSKLLKLETLLLSQCGFKYVQDKDGSNPFENLVNLKRLFVGAYLRNENKRQRGEGEKEQWLLTLNG